jgi:hypothetical protein
LLIDRPVRIQGQAGTVFEVFGGSIIIDFRSQQEEELKEKPKEEN